MGPFFQDIWHDLREKRLWPIAALLLIGVVAIPAVLMKSAAEPSPAPTVATNGDSSDGPGVDLQVAQAPGVGSGSALGSFDPKNPFKPPEKVLRSGSATASEASAGGTADDAAGGESSPGGESPSGSAPVAPETPSAPPTTAEYEYVADVTFWNGKRRREIKGMRKLDMLPNEAAPVLIFMGATGNGGNAVFLVDSTLRAMGEGDCVPSRSNCAFVHIGPGAEHAFTNEAGDSYRLRIDEIRRVRLGGHGASTAVRKRNAANAATSAEKGARRFSLPGLSDLVVVTGGEASGTPDTGR